MASINKIGPAIQLLRFDDKLLSSSDYSLPINIDSYDNIGNIFNSNSENNYNLHKIVSQIPVASGLVLNNEGNPEIIYNNVLPGQPVFIPFMVNNNGNPFMDWAVVIGTINTNSLSPNSSAAIFPSFNTVNNVIDSKLEDYKLSISKLGNGLFMDSNEKLAINLSNDKVTAANMYFKPNILPNGDKDNVHTSLATLPIELGGYVGNFDNIPVEMRDIIKNTSIPVNPDKPVDEQILVPKYGTLKENGNPSNPNDYYFNLVSVIRWLYDVMQGGIGTVNAFTSIPNGVFILTSGVDPYEIDIWTEDQVNSNLNYNKYGIRSLPYKNDSNQNKEGLYLNIYRGDIPTIPQRLQIDEFGSLFVNLKDIGLGKIVTGISNNEKLFNFNRKDITTDEQLSNNGVTSMDININVSKNNNNRLSLKNNGLYVSNIINWINNLNETYSTNQVRIRFATEATFNPQIITDNGQITFLYK